MCRWSYLPCDIRLDQHFQPVIKRALDGMLTIDFRAFDLLTDAGNMLADHSTQREKRWSQYQSQDMLSLEMAVCLMKRLQAVYPAIEVAFAQ